MRAAYLLADVPRFARISCPVTNSTKCVVDGKFEKHALFELGNARGVPYALVKTSPVLLRVPTGVFPRADKLAGRRAQIITSGSPRHARFDLDAVAAGSWNVAAGLKLPSRTFGGHARPGWKEFLCKGLSIGRNMGYNNFQGVVVNLAFAKDANALKEFVQVRRRETADKARCTLQAQHAPPSLSTRAPPSPVLAHFGVFFNFFSQRHARKRFRTEQQLIIFKLLGS